MLFDETLKNLFLQSKNIAIIGAKDKAGQPVDNVGRYLIQAGFRVFPVHPVRENVWDLKTYRNLNEIQEPIDIVNLFRASEYCLAHAQEALRLTPLPKVFWMQQGISNMEAGKLLAAHGVKVVEDSCIMVDHARLLA
ncbi:CoA-binding protein [Desulfovibrio litoralis]|uniref:CoA-binding domain-containing protein n=1 Tax=Desulfovibrio litoralis DSM 11393 TaxID=1121455 RepID=A0A1M7SA89_9BACT|nr:CoA-binding protein [Desulfovibrio litoralis]SHN55401.1 hypothetical protein SAMN02745728_00667 [Desulfovibrio litoralis DSM 11393]